MTTCAGCSSEARALLVRDGWRNDGHSGPCTPDRNEPRCAEGAVDAAATDQHGGYDSVLYLRALRVLGGAVGAGQHQSAIGGITGWNDAQPDVAPVLAAFDRAIEALT